MRYVSRQREIGLGLALGLALGLGCGGDGASPELAAVQPARTAVNTMVTVTGAHLCGPAGTCALAGGSLQIGLAAPVLAPLASYSDTQLAFVVPSVTPVGATELVLTVNDTASNALAFEVTP